MTRWSLLLVGLFLLAGGIRVASIDSSTILGERQYRSALITRYHYYASLDAVDPWKLRIAQLNREREGRLEPPILERGVALIYRVVGGEHLWIPRLLSILFWLAGGVFLYRLALRFIPPEGAAVSTGYYLLNPMGMSVSVGILPDPLMIALFVLALLSIVRFHEHPGVARLGFAAGSAALAVLVKPFCLFAILGAIIALAIHRHGLRRSLLEPSVLVLVGATLAPAIGFYGYGMLTPVARPGGEVASWDTLARSASVSFAPHLLFDREFWTGWVRTAFAALRPTPLIAGLIGLPLLRNDRGFPLVAGVAAGYVAFCLTFTYLTPFAGHYHLQLLVVVGLGMGALAAVVMQQIRSALVRPYVWAFPVAAVLLLFWVSARTIRSQLTPGTMEREELAREVGERIRHSDRVVHLAPYYGKPLQYHGEFYGTWWPPAGGDGPTRLRRQNRSVSERLDVLDFEPEYFVITDLAGYRLRHSDLRAFLETNCRVLAHTDEYLIYSGCAGRDPENMGPEIAGSGRG